MSGVLILLAVALVVAPKPAPATARLRVLVPAGGRTASWRIGLPTGRTGSVAVVAAAGAFGFASVAMSVGGGVILPAIAGAVACATAGRVVATAIVRRRRDRLAAAQLDSVAAMAAEVRAGQQPDVALRTVGSVPEVLHGLWALSERSGAPVATVLDRLEDDLRTRTKQRRTVATELAGAHSTALLLAALPALGLALGAAMGATPLTVLFGTTTGQLALLAGVVLDSAGVLWTARIVAAVDGER